MGVVPTFGEAFEGAAIDDETPAPSRDPMVGRVLDGRYELLGVIGSGGMSTVYRARDARLGRDVAIKVLHSHFAADQSFVERFRQEAEFAAGLSAHPNIVSIFDVGEDGDLHYIVMELIDGRNLKDLIRAEAPLSVDRTFRIGQSIASALAFAHQRGLIHRDIKPQNILVSTDGAVKVTDFGIARSAGASQTTRTGVVMGTAHYISPEQAQGTVATAASDIYSLGVVLFEMLTGNLLFDADNPLGVAMKHVHDVPTPPNHLNPSIPLTASAVVLRALSKNPDGRYRSASEFGLAMQRQDAGTTDQATTVQPIAGGVPPSAGDETFIVRHAPPPVVPPPPAPPTGPDEPQPNPARTLLLVLAGLILIAALAAGGFAIGKALTGPGATPTPTSTPTSTATAVPTPTAKPTPKPTSTSSPTPVPPTPTSTPIPPTPTPMPTSTPAPSPTPTPSG